MLHTSTSAKGKRESQCMVGFLVSRLAVQSQRSGTPSLLCMHVGCMLDAQVHRPCPWTSSGKQITRDKVARRSTAPWLIQVWSSGKLGSLMAMDLR